MKFLGFDFSIKNDPERELKAVVPDSHDDGAIVVDVGTGMGDVSGAVGESYAYSTTFDLDAESAQEAQLIQKYREISLVSEVESAIDDIINEFVSTEHNDLVDIDLDALPYSEGIKKKIKGEFDHILKLMEFNSKAYEIIRRWYTDGRLNYQVVVNPDTAQKIGIAKLVYLDPRLLKKVRVVRTEVEPETNATLYSNVDEFYMFSEKGFTTATAGMATTAGAEGIKMTAESVASITSGLMNSTNRITLSYLHKAIRPLNLLKSLEDAAVIYRLVRAPERRIFYIDVGNLPPAKAEQQLRKQMQQFRSKSVFDPKTGLVKTDAKHMTMMEDYFLPRNGQGKATEVVPLPPGQNLGQMEEVTYMLQQLYKSLNVPISRLDSQNGFMFGRVTEISRDEVKFMKFIARLRRRFSGLFLDLLKKQLVLKGIVTSTEFDNIRQLISFEFTSDNTFEESMQNEVMSGRLAILTQMDAYKGIYFSRGYIQREVLRFSDEDIEQIEQEMANEDPTEIEQKAMDAQAEMQAAQVAAIATGQPTDPNATAAAAPSTAAPSSINTGNKETPNGKPSGSTNRRGKK